MHGELDGEIWQKKVSENKNEWRPILEQNVIR